MPPSDGATCSGSLLCSSPTLPQVVHENIAFQFFWGLRIRGSEIPVEKHYALYNATSLSLMMYNCNSWAASKAIVYKVDVCQGKHLRTTTRHRQRDSIIANDALYDTCNAVPLSVKLAQYIWFMFGHLLRMSEDTPTRTPTTSCWPI